ncbi:MULTISPECIES: hypothetical protein [unclassified Okeania]|nr:MULTISPECIES: hypothetical protein [unclassified Okeania]
MLVVFHWEGYRWKDFENNKHIFMDASQDEKNSAIASGEDS